MPLDPEIDETYLALSAALGERRIAYVHFMDLAASRWETERAPTLEHSLPP